MRVVFKERTGRNKEMTVSFNTNVMDDDLNLKAFLQNEGYEKQKHQLAAFLPFTDDDSDAAAKDKAKADAAAKDKAKADAAAKDKAKADAAAKDKAKADAAAKDKAKADAAAKDKAKADAAAKDKAKADAAAKDKAKADAAAKDKAKTNDKKTDTTDTSGFDLDGMFVYYDIHKKKITPKTLKNVATQLKAEGVAVPSISAIIKEYATTKNCCTKAEEETGTKFDNIPVKDRKNFMTDAKVLWDKHNSSDEDDAEEF